MALADIERHAVEQALERTRYVQKDAAELLGVTRRTADREWRYVRARLHLDLSAGEQGPAVP